MAQAKVFKDACKEWKHKLNNKKTWPNFKQLFFEVYVEQKEENKYSTEDYSDNNLSNYARDTVEAFQSML